MTSPLASAIGTTVEKWFALAPASKLRCPTAKKYLFSFDANRLLPIRLDNMHWYCADVCAHFSIARLEKDQKFHSEQRRLRKSEQPG
jgi:hypothetical protein